MKIWIAIVDDWELRGNGLGNVIDLQFKPAIRLMDLYEKLGIKGTFNIEVMQQLAFEKYAEEYPEIKEQRDYWIKSVTTMLERGFDIQLHTHPQWHNAQYDGKYWKLDKRWNIVDYNDELIEEFISGSIDYLKTNFKINKIVSFRGGGWGVCCPSRKLFEMLEKYGIEIDISLVKGIYFDGESIKLDYTNLESPYFPYYPDYDDVRKISKSKTNIIEIPTQSVSSGDLSIAERICLNMLRIKHIKPYLLRGVRKRIKQELPEFIVRDPFGFGNYRFSCLPLIIDLSSPLTLYAFKIAVNAVIRRALQRGFPNIPLIFENHTKDLTDEQIKKIEQLIGYIKSKYKDIVKFVTLKEIVDNIDLFSPLLKVYE